MGATFGTLALILVMGICFAASGLLRRFITPHAQQIILRFMGMILIAIAADMMLSGFQQSVGSSAKEAIPGIVDQIDQDQQKIDLKDEATSSAPAPKAGS